MHLTGGDTVVAVATTNGKKLEEPGDNGEKLEEQDDNDNGDQAEGETE